MPTPAPIRVWIPEGLIVRDPLTRQALEPSADGVEVPRTTYFLRRIADGDLLIHPPKAPPAPRRATARSADQPAD